MGSSKTGSLDAFAPFSLPAALAAGKVKLPATGVVGMLQKRQEDKMTKNAANMAGQPQQTPYDQMMMQMMGQQKRPEFMSPYSPAPYANGGNVALRRKMFKLGGSASAHGTGLTSGLAFNEGGSVKPGPDGKPRQHAIIGGIIKAILVRGAYDAASGKGTRKYGQIAKSRAFADMVDSVESTVNRSARVQLRKARARSRKTVRSHDKFANWRERYERRRQRRQRFRDRFRGKKRKAIDYDNYNDQYQQQVGSNVMGYYN